MTVITFIGAGSTVFTKNIAGDILHRPALRGATIRLMDINPRRLEESEVVVSKLAKSMDAHATVETFSDQRRALEGADFVVVSFQIGGFEPATVTDFEVPKRVGLRQTIADTLGVGGIMRGLRTVPHLWSICEDMMEVCPQAIMLQYVNPMAINTWAIGARFPQIRQVGLCHSVQGTAAELAHDLDIPVEEIRYRAGGINHMSFYLAFEHRQPDGSYVDLYPALREGYRAGVDPVGAHVVVGGETDRDDPIGNPGDLRLAVLVPDGPGRRSGPPAAGSGAPSAAAAGGAKHQQAPGPEEEIPAARLRDGDRGFWRL